MKQVRFGVIGCGSIAKKSFVPALMKAKNAKLITVASRSKDKAKLFSLEFDCEYDYDYESLLGRNDIDAVYISTVPATHESIIMLAAKYEKHILCEKPLTTSYNSAKKIVNYTKIKNVGIFEGFMYQFHSQHEKIKKLINKGEIGRPILFQAQFGFPPLDNKNFRYSKNLGGGALLDAGCYTIHAARNFFGREPINVDVCIDFNNEDVDIHGSVLLDFGSSQTAFLSYGFNNSYRNNYTIWGTNGHLTVKKAFSVPIEHKATIVIERHNSINEIICNTDNQFVNQIEYYSDNILKNDIHKIWAKDILMQSKIIEDVIHLS